jgi:hypothetical protein
MRPLLFVSVYRVHASWTCLARSHLELATDIVRCTQFEQQERPRWRCAAGGRRTQGSCGPSPPAARGSTGLANASTAPCVTHGRIGRSCARGRRHGSGWPPIASRIMKSDHPAVWAIIPQLNSRVTGSSGSHRQVDAHISTGPDHWAHARASTPSQWK